MDEVKETSSYHSYLVPLAGYHFGDTQVTGTGYTLDQGPMVGLRLKIEKQSYFFAPDIQLLEVFGLDQSPTTLASVGFIAGARIRYPATEIYLGAAYRIYLSYPVNGGIFGRFGFAWAIAANDLQIFVEVLYGQFNQSNPNSPLSTYFNEFAPEFGLQLPFAL